uniref:Peptidase A2 domain-containing protein n=1 Tax=Knipowitschia caucasica TaxID=637954 RepID=A0AAV2KRX7_KNICA
MTFPKPPFLSTHGPPHRSVPQRSVDNGPNHVARDPDQTTGPHPTTADPQHTIRRIDHFDPRLDPPTSQAMYHMTDHSRDPGTSPSVRDNPLPDPAHRDIKYETHGYQTHRPGLTADHGEQRPATRQWDGQRYYPDYRGRDAHYTPPIGRDPLGPSDRDFDRIARHINRFDPRPGMPTNARSYLRDVDFHTDRIPNASQSDKIFLIRLTSNREVNDFIERQPKAIKHDYNELCKAILAEYSDYGASGTLTAAMAVKQTHNELADCYYHRLRQAYFGNQNYEGMEEDKNFKALYIQNLHPNLSQLLAGRERPRTAAINKSNLSREEQSFLRALLRKAREKRPDTADVFAVSVSDETNDDYPYHLNDDLSVQQSEDTYFDPHVLRDLQDKVNKEPRDSHAQNENAHYDQRDVMVIRVNSITDSRRECPSTINCDPPFHQFIGDLQQKGTYGKLYLPVTLEDQWEHKALVDTAADISLIADYLFGKLQSLAREAHRDLKTQPCDLEIRPYSQVNTTIRKMALMRLTVGPMTLVHPVYISPFNAHPLLLGQDLLNRLKPIIDFQRLKIWAQVREPLPIPRPLGENHCYFIEAPPADGLQPAAAQTNTGQGTPTICAIGRANATKMDPTPRPRAKPPTLTGWT